MKYSIVIPAFNVENYIKESIDSVLSQDYKDYELIIVNDGSTDQTEYICNQYLKSFEIDYKIISQKNKGLYATRDVGILNAKGDYIISLDGDDVLRSDALSIINQNISNKDIDVLMYDLSVRSDFRDTSERMFKEGYVGKEEIIKKICSTNKINNVCTKVFKRDLLKYVDHCSIYGKKINMGEDLLRTVGLISKGEKFYYINQPLYYYRQNQNSITRKVDIETYNDLIYVRTYLLKFAKEWSHQYKLDLMPKIWGKNIDYLRDYLYLRYSTGKMSVSELEYIEKNTFYEHDCKLKLYPLNCRIDNALFFLALRQMPKLLFIKMLNARCSLKKMLKVY